jgi:uncharacterized cupin superfamily protein
MERKPATVFRAGEMCEKRVRLRQRLNENPKAVFDGFGLSGRAGLASTGVSIAWLEPGRETFAYHAHHYSEEWIYILDGRAMCLIDEVDHTLEPSDFVGFPTPSVPHLLKNPFGETCTYLMGGERRSLDILDYPRLGKTYFLRGSAAGTDFFELPQPIRPFGPAES